MKRIRFYSQADVLFGHILAKAGLKRHNLGFKEANEVQNHPAFKAALKSVEEKYPDAILYPRFNTRSETPVNFQIRKILEK